MPPPAYGLFLRQTAILTIPGVIHGLSAGNGPLTISNLEREARRANRAAIIGAVMLVAGLVLTMSNLVIYVGSFPDERPLYLAGIGVVLFFVGVITLAAGLFMSHLFRREAVSQPDASGRP